MCAQKVTNSQLSLPHRIKFKKNKRTVMKKTFKKTKKTKMRRRNGLVMKSVELVLRPERKA